MKLSARWILTAPIFTWTALRAGGAAAAIDNAGLLDDVLIRYSNVASTWGTTITTHATWLFWLLATVSMVWTFGMMALRKADIAEFFAEFARFTIFTGFFWWLLTNGPQFAVSIMNSLRQIASQANGASNDLTPSGIVDIGFDIFARVLEMSTVWSPFASAVGVLISLITLIVLALIAVNMLVLLVSGWVLAYAGIFFLGFGGSRWTSDMAIAYFKTVLSVAAQLFTMVLLVGIGKSFIDSFYSRISNGLLLNELAVVMIASLVLLVLVNKVPGLVGGIPSGGGTGSLGTGHGAGSVAAAAAIGAAAAATAGAATVAGLANIAGGAQSLMAAYKKASAESAGAGDLMAALGTSGALGTGSVRGGDALSAAMGDVSQSSTNGGGDIRPPQASHRDDGNTSGEASAPQSEGEPDTGTAAGVGESTATSAMGQNRSSSRHSSLQMVAKVGRLATGTAANLAKGSWNVAKDNLGKIKETAVSRVAETTGGKIAAAINARNLAANLSDSTSSDGLNSLSAGKSDKADASAEVAAFRDSKRP